MKRISLVSMVILLSTTVVFAQGERFTWMRDLDKNRVDDRVDSLARYAPDSTVNLIINYCRKPDSEDIANLLEYGELHYVMRYINAVALRRVKARDVHRIRAYTGCPKVVMVELDEMVYAALDVSTRAVKARGSALYSPNTAWELGFRGAGINIAILDTGVDDGHPALDDMDDDPQTDDPKFVAGYNAITDVVENPDDDQTHYWDKNLQTCVLGNIFHGTHVAAIALGTGDGTDFIGVAPEAKLIDVKVLNWCGEGLATDIIRGIDWCIDHRNEPWAGQSPEYYGIDVLNMSLGGDFTDGQDALSLAVNQAVNHGLVVVVSAGNEGPNPFTITTPGAADNAITVGNVWDQNTIARGDDVIAMSSSRGPRLNDGDLDAWDEQKPDVVAPGTQISSAWGVDPGQVGAGYHNLTGTSMAAPHVAGIAALILQNKPTFTPTDVKNRLILTATDMGVGGWDRDYGWGLVDAFNALPGTKPVPADLWIHKWGDPPGSPPPWETMDIWLDHYPAQPGDPNQLYAKIHNNSSVDALNVEVSFSYHTFGVGIPEDLWIPIGTDIVNVPANSIVTADVTWIPEAGYEHQCIRVKINYANDPVPGNNMAQENVIVLTSSSPTSKHFQEARIPIRFFNPSDEDQLTFPCVYPEKLPEDCAVAIKPDSVLHIAPRDTAGIKYTLLIRGNLTTKEPIRIHVAQWFFGSKRPVGGITITNEPPMGVSERKTEVDFFYLSQNYPNPFNAETSIRYVLPEEAHVRLIVYNLLGQRVRTLVDERQKPGHHMVYWDGRDDGGKKATSGIYFYKIVVSNYTETKKMILLQ